MVIRKSSTIRDMRIITVRIPEDVKGTRLVTYSWSTLLSSGSHELFPHIFRNTLCGNNVLHGYFLYPSSTLLIRCIRGHCKLICTDLRKDEPHYLQSETVEQSAENLNQVYIPAGVAWGVLSFDDEIELQIQSSEDILCQSPVVFDPLDPRFVLPNALRGLEFALDNHSVEPISVDQYEELTTPNQDEEIVDENDPAIEEELQDCSGNEINIQNLSIPGSFMITHKSEITDRFLEEIYSYDDLAQNGLKKVFIQHFEMHFSSKNTVRGFYIQDAPWTNNQLFICTSGQCKVILLDLRDKKPSYLSHTSVVLDGKNRDSLYFESGIAYTIVSQQDNTSLYCLSDNTISVNVHKTVSVFDDRFKDELPSSGIISSAADRMAPKAEELPHNYW